MSFKKAGGSYPRSPFNRIKRTRSHLVTAVMTDLEELTRLGTIPERMTVLLLARIVALALLQQSHQFTVFHRADLLMLYKDSNISIIYKIFVSFLQQKSPTQCRAWNISARWVYRSSPSSPSSPSIGFSCFWADADCMRSIALCWAPRMRAISSSGASVRASISTADSSDTRPA